MLVIESMNPCMYKKIFAVVHLVPLACTPGYYGKARGRVEEFTVKFMACLVASNYQ